MTPLPCWLAILFSILPASVVYSSITINLYVSESMGESTLIQLLQTVEPIQGTNMVTRGMAVSDSSLIHTITRWQTRMKAAGAVQGIQINPVAFRDNTIERVPAITVSNNDQTVLTVIQHLI